jgi:hypothetical protein
MKQNSPDFSDNSFSNSSSLNAFSSHNRSAHSSYDPRHVVRDQREEAIRRRAEEIYIRNGKVAGYDVHNWMQAEKEILREAAERAGRRTAVVINVNGIRYIGEYWGEFAEGYTPGEFAAGGSVPVRFEGDQMFVQRPNGRGELRTTLVKRAL